MKILINYADEKYKNTQKFNSWSGKYIAKFDKVVEYSPSDIDNNFTVRNKDIFNHKRGNGLWIWKPYIILETLKKCKDGDIVFYCDSGSFFTGNIDRIIESMGEKEYIWVSDIPLIESCFTKPICFEKMNCNREDIKNTNQIQASFFMAKRCDKSIEFVQKWINYCTDYELLSPEGTLEINKDMGRKFVVHREDQSILSLLCKSNGIRAHKDPTQRGKYPETYYNKFYDYMVNNHYDKYKPIIFLHKQPNVNIVGIIKIIVKSYLSKIKYYLK